MYTQLFKYSKTIINSIIIAISLFALLNSCTTIKTVHTLRKGKVEEKHFKIAVPFEDNLGLTVIKVKVNGKDFKFVLDTGAPTAITKDYAEEMGFEPELSQVFKDGNGGMDTVNLITLQEIEIGGIKFQNNGAAIMDMSQSKEIQCLGVSGIIGANLMSKAFWQWDFKNKIVTIASSRELLNISENDVVIPFVKSFLTNQFYIDIQIGDFIDKHVLVDIGANGNYSSSKSTFDSLQTHSLIQKYTYGYGSNASAAFGLNKDSVFYGSVSEFKVGSNSHANQIITFSGSNKSVGVGYFENFITTVDWRKDELILSPKTTYGASKLIRYPFNIVFIDNKLQIGFVYDCPEIKSNKISIGDQVLAINGIDYSNFSESDYCEFFKSMYEYENDTMEIKLLNKSGELNTYTFHRYNLLNNN